LTLLAELKNDITREAPASVEPSIDYVVTKIPRFAFEVLAHDHHSTQFPRLRPISASQDGAASQLRPPSSGFHRPFRTRSILRFQPATRVAG
jgi:hypothetical protein